MGGTEDRSLRDHPEISIFIFPFGLFQNIIFYKYVYACNNKGEIGSYKEDRFVSRKSEEKLRALNLLPEMFTFYFCSFT